MFWFFKVSLAVRLRQDNTCLHGFLECAWAEVTKTCVLSWMLTFRKAFALTKKFVPVQEIKPTQSAPGCMYLQRESQFKKRLESFPAMRWLWITTCNGKVGYKQQLSGRSWAPRMPLYRIGWCRAWLHWNIGTQWNRTELPDSNSRRLSEKLHRNKNLSRRLSHLTWQLC